MNEAQLRTHLRKVTRDDEQELTTLMRSSINLHEPWISPPTNATTFRLYLQRVNRADHEGFLVCLRSTDEIVGVINLNNIIRGSFLSASLGYYVVASHEGSGYMLEGLQQVLHYACSTMGLHRLEANIQPDNIRSQRLVERCGFQREGVSKNFLFINGAWRDHVRWCYVDQRSSLRASHSPASILRSRS